MALVLSNRVQETSTTTGTGTLTLAGAVLGYQTFAAGIGSGNTCYYAITSSTGAWEVGVGTVGTGTLARTTLLSSSTGSLVSFTGTLNVYVTYPSEKSVNLDASNNLTVLNTSYLGGASGNQSLQVNNVASAVNYAQIVGAVTGGSPTISALGTDTNISLGVTVKGTGNINLSNGNGLQVQVNDSGGTAVNYFSFGGSVTNSAPAMVMKGSDANVGASLTTKGTGGYVFWSGNFSRINAVINSVASSVNFLQLAPAVTGAAPIIYADGSDANVGLVLNGKGTGVVALGGSTVANSGVQVFPVASSVNYVALSGASAGNSPALGVGGTNANVSFIFQTKGSGGYGFYTNYNTAQLGVSHTASAVNYLQITGAITTGAPELSAQGSDANIALKLTPKGTGGVSHTGTAFTPNFNLTDAATIAWDTTTAGGQVATFTFVSSNRTMGAPTNLINGAFYALAVIQNAGSNTLTWNSVFKWAAGTAPTLSTAAGAKDYFTFRSDGTNLYQQGISQAVA
jgi:hypothetical protein